MKLVRYICFYSLFLSLLIFRSNWARAVDAPAKATKTEKVEGTESPEVEAVDIPTADILDVGTYSTNFRFYSEGGIVSRLVFGPLKRINLGIYFDAQHIVGGGEPHLITPSVYFKLRAFDGNDYLPALSLGYDNQGYIWQRRGDEFQQEGKGLYLVGSHEILIPDLFLHAGANINDFNNDKIYGFFGATYRIVSSFGVMAEYDNIRNGPENKVNLGGRYWVTSFFNIDIAARNVGRNADRGAERIVRLNYVGNFPF